jgi:glycosyltransferase involved in cell wall biosynthesis
MIGVSVIIYCYNSSKRLPKTLDHLKEQEVPLHIKWEVIVVDNASTDNTADLAREYWSNHTVPLHVVTELKTGLSNARKAGIDNSKYDYVTFVDDDNWVEKHGLEKLFNILDSNENVALCGGRGIGVYETEAPFWFENFQNDYAIGPQYKSTGIIPNNKAFLYGAGMGIKKDIFIRLIKSGFNFWLSGRNGTKLGSGDDYELCLAIPLLGYKLYYDDNMTFYHYMPAIRLKWDYLVNMIHGFGRASPVLQIYQAEVFNYKRINLFKSYNYYMSVMVSFYRLLLTSFKILPLAFSDKTGEVKYYSLIYSLHSFKAKLASFKMHKNVVADIRFGKWKTFTNNL